MRAVLKHPLPLAGVVLGLLGAAVAFWRQDVIDSYAPIVLAGMIAFSSAVTLARRLGLEPADDPAAPHNQRKR